jgi:hypothetical protein
MPLPSSGQISLNQVNVELGLSGTAQIGLGDSAVRTLFDVASGQITMSNGYGKANVYEVFVTADALNLNVSTYAVANGWDGTTPLLLTVNAGVWLYSNSTSTAGLIIPSSMSGLITIENYGNIVGDGGGSNSAGGPAISNSATGVVINNYSGAFIAGGGGGGGGSQGGGGAGQAAPGQAGAAGGNSLYPIGLSGVVATFGCSEGGTVSVSASCTAWGSRTIGAGGQQGASAGSGTTTGGSCYAYGSGSGGGPPPCTASAGGTLSGGGGALNPGGQGGSILSASSNQTVSGGGWGLQGAGGGGAGGAAVAGTTVTMSNSGTLYGTVA